MELFGLPMDQIADLGTQIAQAGTLRSLEAVADGVFEYTVGVAILIYEQNPPA